MFITGLLILLLFPAFIIAISAIWMNHPPKEINAMAGYRTYRSMRSPETWKFAHKYVCRLWLYTEFPTGVVSVVIFILFRGYGSDTLGCITFLAMMGHLLAICLPMIPTEKALEKNFDKNGNRRIFL